MRTVFVSGPTGCIGAATVSHLLENGVDEIVGFSRREDFSRISKQYHDRIRFIAGDITDAESVQQAVSEAEPSAIIHLAAYQTPDCQARPMEGLAVNVLGTANIFSAAVSLGDSLHRFVFASSAAVYGPRSLYTSDSVTTDVPYLPPNLYGYWKVAGEGVAQAFFAETGISTVSLRLATTYGPGRDLGLTSAPTTAIKSAVLGTAYRLPYHGREHFHFVEDVGAGFSLAATDSFEGYGAFNLRGRTVPTDEYLAALREACVASGVDGVDVGVAEDATTMPFVCDLDDEATLAAFPRMPLTSLEDGLRISVTRFQQMVIDGTMAEA
ncbi:MAG TPA: NAD(P)-dependent oxidoreductase [Planctomycetaceae bacterium]|nr:NAD(P)-dependent oxidoreductase [Planctomycetaceae bacterium]